MDKKRRIIISIFIIIFLILIFVSFLYYNNKYSIIFETGTDEIILTKYVKKYNKVDEPMEPIKEGYVFKEWQLNGKTYDFDDEITKDTVLTAKWVKEEYITITFDTNSDKKIESKKILKGEIIKDLPDSTKENYEFIGWYLNGMLYNNEQIYDNIILLAEYKNNTINTTYKVGDRVKVINKYSNSAYSLEATNKKAIGWERKIIGIIDNSEYPYIIGNNEGVTGFFKASSIQKI